MGGSRRRSGPPTMLPNNGGWSCSASEARLGRNHGSSLPSNPRAPMTCLLANASSPLQRQDKGPVHVLTGHGIIGGSVQDGFLVWICLGETWWLGSTCHLNGLYTELRQAN